MLKRRPLLHQLNKINSLVPNRNSQQDHVGRVYQRDINRERNTQNYARFCEFWQDFPLIENGPNYDDLYTIRTKVIRQR